MAYLQVIAGFVLLLGSAEVLLRGSVAIARRFNLSTLIIGMTIVAFGTSLPELVVSLDAAFAGAPDIAVGNIVGSNIANLLLIIGISGLVFPIAARDRPLLRDGFTLLAVSLLFAALLWHGVIGRGVGAALLIALLIFLVWSYWQETHGDTSLAAETLAQEAAEVEGLPGRSWVVWGAVIAGLAGIMLGADLLVEGSVAVARAAGVSEAVIGLSLVAVGTSLPELAASLVAAVRGHSDIAVGNVVGSNLFNMLCVGGSVAVAAPLTVAGQIQGFDVWIMLAATLAFIPFLLKRLRFGRLMGAAFVGAYATYMVVLYYGPPNVFSLIG
jgi:cation:H+ antiporter